MHQYIPKIKNSDCRGTLISDILTQMLVPPFSLEIPRKLPYFVFFYYQKFFRIFKTFQNNLNYIHVKNNPKLMASQPTFGLSPCQPIKICKNFIKDIKHTNISFYFFTKKSTKCCRSVVNFLLNSSAK